MATAVRVGLVFGAALLYGLITRLVFVWGEFGDKGWIVSLSFIFLMPLCFGALTTFLGYRIFGRSNFWLLWAPMLVSFLGLLGSVLFKLEAVLCVLVASPVVLPFAFLGGLLMGWILSRGSGKMQVSLLVLLPFAMAPLEAMWEKPHERVAITDTIDIKAAPQRVWQEIASVAPIMREELPFQWIYLLDFPRPIAAEIDREGVGARRLATFERGVSFYETVTEWEPTKRLSFTITADPEFIPHTAFDQHIIVGGRFYDVLDGAYEIEPTVSGTRLILTSTHRLATPFNAYAGFWSKWVMNQIQGSILTVIKARAEKVQG